jgi:hypothetical protein
LVESMLDSFGLMPVLAVSNRDCGQLANVGVPEALTELPPERHRQC